MNAVARRSQQREQLLLINMLLLLQVFKQPVSHQHHSRRQLHVCFDFTHSSSHWRLMLSDLRYLNNYLKAFVGRKGRWSNALILSQPHDTRVIHTCVRRYIIYCLHLLIIRPRVCVFSDVTATSKCKSFAHAVECGLLLIFSADPQLQSLVVNRILLIRGTTRDEVQYFLIKASYMSYIPVGLHWWVTVHCIYNMRFPLSWNVRFKPVGFFSEAEAVRHHEELMCF